MAEVLAVLVAGVAQGVPLFLVASGLTLIYGVIRVLNFAHGAFFMVGAFLTYAVLGGRVPGLLPFLVAVLVGALVAAACSVVAEVAVVRRLYEADHVTMLLGTYAVLLTMEGLAEVVWGRSSYTQRQPEALAGSFGIGGARIAVYDVLLVAVGAAVAAGLWYLVNRTRFGQSIRAIAQDATMAQAIGLNSSRLLLTVFVVGSLLAGLAGGLVAPLVAINPSIGDGFVLQCFAVVIIGGLGSVPGSLLAALLVGLLETISVNYVPALTGFTLYIVVAVVLLLRPQGLLGGHQVGAH